MNLIKAAIFSLFFVLLVAGCNHPHNDIWQERKDFAKYFDDAGVNGGFILFDLKQETYVVYNPQRINTGFIPASTFKIFNSLVALETKQIQDASEIIKWDGRQRGFAAWNQDHNLQSAIQNSVVWFYQDLARRIGPEQMAHYVTLAEYGNQDIRGEIDTFWLEGELRITPREQVDFLRRLYQNELPFSQRSIDIVKDILIFEAQENYIMRAKTGWGQRYVPQIGWFVGYVEQHDNVYLFATNIDIANPEDAEKRVVITKHILNAMGLL